MGELHFCLLCHSCTALVHASSLSRKLAYVPGPTFGFVKPLCLIRLTLHQVSPEQHRQAGFESRLVPDLPSPQSPLQSAFGLLTFCQVVSGWRQQQISASSRLLAFLRSPRAYSGLRSGAWLCKRNNGRLGAFN